MKKTLLLFLSLPILTSCMSMMGRKYQDVSVTTTPPGYKVSIGDKSCVSPCELKGIYKASPEFKLTVENIEYSHFLPRYLSIDNARSAALVNFWSFGIGNAIDMMSGADHQILPLNIFVATQENK